MPSEFSRKWGQASYASLHHSIVCTLPPSSFLRVGGVGGRGGEGWVSYQIAGGAVAVFSWKNKLKSEPFNDKKLQTKMFFSAITKNLNWKILTKNSVTLRWDGAKDEKF